MLSTGLRSMREIAMDEALPFARQGTPQAGSDWRDIASLLLAFPALKTKQGDVLGQLRAHNASDAVINEWNATVQREILPDNDEY
ncbi:MAG: hypothetical protein SGI88_15025 [Candidatus Hydrogenedentes bacterium]|nr:hypothetical protein [Candidatus Hydrogenedentota bacterium]